MVIKIECDRRIKKLNIEFGDGEEDEIEFEEYTSEVKTKKETKPQKRKETLLSTSDEEIPQAAQEILEIPVIEEKERTPLVSDDMKNLEF